VTFWLLVIPTICYLISGVLMLREGDYAGCLTFGAYGVANCGLIWKFLG